MLTALQGCLSDACEEELLEFNPALRGDKMLRKRLRQKKKDIEIFTASELQALLEASLQLRPMIFPAILTLARTGLRIGEAFALQVGDIDFIRNQIYVRRTWIASRKAGRPEDFNSPKSGRMRVVDMSNQLSETLYTYIEKHQPRLWLFETSSGAPLDTHTFRDRYWVKLFSLTGIPYRSPHTLRHTYATYLIQRGENLTYIKEQLGHASIKITVDTYGHLLGMANPGIVNHLDDTTICNPYATIPKNVLQIP